jgi:hypothetical protein
VETALGKLFHLPEQWEKYSSYAFKLRMCCSCVINEIETHLFEL